jgi:hypothetical protein
MDMCRISCERLPKSLRKHVREEKARIRRATDDPELRAKKLADLYAKAGLPRETGRYAG